MIINIIIRFGGINFFLVIYFIKFIVIWIFVVVYGVYFVNIVYVFSKVIKFIRSVFWIKFICVSCNLFIIVNIFFCMIFNVYWFCCEIVINFILNFVIWKFGFFWLLKVFLCCCRIDWFVCVYFIRIMNMIIWF